MPRVSIHAPGRGATSAPRTPTIMEAVSIHAPGRGATVFTRTPQPTRSSFNSRTREGCDGFAGRGSACCVVSIHAPGRGATQIRTHCGGAHAFQFTHPGGVRLGYLPFKVFVSSFNSRTREGCDCIAFAVHLVSKVSIHAPGRGATCTRLLPLRRHACFNSRTREGCDPLHLAYEDPDLTFQFTHPGGVRLTRIPIEFHRDGFQFTHPGGVRLNISQTNATTIWFQFTHPGGVRPMTRRDRTIGI